MIKRTFDIILSSILLIIFSPVFIITSVLILIKLGRPIIFKQKRPGLDNKIFTIYKFRTMKNSKNNKNEYLPDELRMTKLGDFLRSSSLDELPELINILKGDMSFVGPRPQLVKDLVFMTDKEKVRHSVKPGLTGLAQINGRNNISWEQKFKYDLEYIQKTSFIFDIKILYNTFFRVIKKEDINTDGMATSQDLGDYLLDANKITKEYYLEKIEECKRLIGSEK